MPVKRIHSPHGEPGRRYVMARPSVSQAPPSVDRRDAFATIHYRRQAGRYRRLGEPHHGDDRCGMDLRGSPSRLSHPGDAGRAWGDAGGGLASRSCPPRRWTQMPVMWKAEPDGGQLLQVLRPVAARRNAPSPCHASEGRPHQDSGRVPKAITRQALLIHTREPIPPESPRPTLRAYERLAPFMKSGNACGLPPAWIDAADSGMMLLQTTAS